MFINVKVHLKIWRNVFEYFNENNGGIFSIVFAKENVS